MNSKEIESTTWYRQATDSRTLYVWTPALAVTDEFNPPAIYAFEGKNHELFYSKKNLMKQAEQFLKKAKKNTLIMDRYSSVFSKKSNELERFFVKLEKTDFSKLAFDDLIYLLKKYDKVIYDFWFVNWLCDKFDPAGHELLKNEIRKAKADLDDEEIEALIVPAELNFIDYSEIDFYSLALTCRKKKQILKKKLSEYSKNYFYVQNSWGVVKILKEKDFVYPLKQVMLLSDKEILATQRRIKSKKRRILRNVNKIIKKRKIKKELKNVFYVYRTLSEIRDARKYYTLKSNHFYYQFAKRLALILRLPVEAVLTYASWELCNSTREQLKKRIKLRRAGALLISWRGTEVYEGTKAKDLISNLKKSVLDLHSELKGFSASRGTAKGNVKIICGHTHFSKFRRGDILVAPMTRPEYLSLMKLAKAIVTDEGGVTSHAAIISRELKKPCVVGTQVATSMLADGDLVEVDANKGTVKKI